MGGLAEILRLEAIAGMTFRPAGAMPTCTPARADRLRASWDGRRKYVPTPAIDERIRRAYALRYQENDRRAIARAARDIGWPKWRLTRRAATLGYSRIKEPAWSNEELEVMGAWRHLTPEAIARKLQEQGFLRTATAVNLKLKRLGLERRNGHYSAHQVALGFGVDGHKVTEWIQNRWLPAELRGTVRTPQQGGDAYLIRHEDLRTFVFEFAEEVDLAKVDKWWFLDLITEGRICR